MEKQARRLTVRPGLDALANAMEQASDDQSVDEYEDDGQPSEYDEWQDFYGGDDWDQGQYDAEIDF
jgi:hypothetical protein